MSGRYQGGAVRVCVLIPMFLGLRGFVNLFLLRGPLFKCCAIPTTIQLSPLRRSGGHMVSVLPSSLPVTLSIPIMGIQSTKNGDLLHISPGPTPLPRTLSHSGRTPE